MNMYKHTMEFLVSFGNYSTTPTPKAQGSPDEGQNNCNNQKTGTYAAI